MDDTDMHDTTKILVIEDDEKVRAVTVKMLESMGYRTVSVENAAAARELLTRESVDLVLSDIILTGAMNGPEYVVEVRALYPDLPIVFMSGFPAEAAQEINKYNAHGTLLSKPFRRLDLDRALRAALD